MEPDYTRTHIVSTLITKLVIFTAQSQVACRETSPRGLGRGGGEQEKGQMCEHFLNIDLIFHLLTQKCQCKCQDLSSLWALGMPSSPTEVPSSWGQRSYSLTTFYLSVEILASNHLPWRHIQTHRLLSDSYARTFGPCSSAQVYVSVLPTSCLPGSLARSTGL